MIRVPDNFNAALNGMYSALRANGYHVKKVELVEVVSGLKKHPGRMKRGSIDYVYAPIIVAVIGIMAIMTAQLYTDVRVATHDAVSDNTWYTETLEPDLASIPAVFDYSYLFLQLGFMFLPLIGAYMVRGNKYYLPISIAIMFFAILSSVIGANIHYQFATDAEMVNGTSYSTNTNSFTNVLPVATGILGFVSLILFYGKPEGRGEEAYYENY